MAYTIIHVLRFLVFFSILALCFFFFAVPNTAKAYLTTSQRAVPIDAGTSVIFTVEYEFGTNKYDVTMPVLAERGSLKNSKAVSYEIMDESGTYAGGKALGIVLSNASLHDGMYTIPKLVAKKFTLFVVFTPDNSKKAGESYRLGVKHLPFVFDEIQEQQLNESELQYYKTPFIMLP